MGLHDLMILLCANMCPKSSILNIYIIDVVFCCVCFLYILLRAFIVFAAWFLFSFFFFFSVLVSIYLLHIFVWCFCFLFCLVSFCVRCEIIVCQKKKKKKRYSKINKIKTPVNFSFAAIDMEKLKITVEYVLFCILPVISKKGFNTTLFPH